MSYEEAIQETVTRAQAILEIERHGADVSEFFTEYGDGPEIKGCDVLAFLGY